MKVRITNCWKYADHETTFEVSLSVLGVPLFDVYFFWPKMFGVGLFGFTLEVWR